MKRRQRERLNRITVIGLGILLVAMLVFSLLPML
jgi:predicted nucleic acid-binding Zn ribbon protein